MARPPIKAFEKVKEYCEKNKDCDGCPLKWKPEDGGIKCWLYTPRHWKIRGEEK